MNPDSYLSTLEPLLTTNGRIVMTVPNERSFIRFVFRKYWIGYQVPTHMYTYSPHSIERLAKKNGLVVEKIRYCQNGYTFLASFRILLRSFSTFWKLPGERSSFFDNYIISQLVFIFLFPLNIIKMGDTVKIFLKKNDRID